MRFLAELFGMKRMQQQLQLLLPIILGDGWLAVRLLLTEPLGLIIPLALMAVVLEAPQMHDMFDAMVGVSRDGQISMRAWHACGYPIAALILTFISWFWTRAALTEAASFPARLALRRASRWGWRRFRDKHRTAGRAWSLWGDAGWLARSRAAPETQNARRLAGRIPPFICLVVLCAPVAVAPDSPAAVLGAAFAWVIYLYIRSRALTPAREFKGWWGWRGVAVLAGIIAASISILAWSPEWLTLIWDWSLTCSATLATLGLMILLLKRLRERPRRQSAPPPCWMWWSRTTALFASAPYGWPAALVLLVLSLGCVAILSGKPEWPDYNLHTPTTVVLAVAAVFTILAVVAAVARDAVWLLVFAVVLFGAALKQALPLIQPRLAERLRDRLVAPRRSVLRGVADGLSAAALVLWLLIIPFETSAPSRHMLRLATPIDVDAEQRCAPAAPGKFARRCFDQAVRAYAARMQQQQPGAANHPAIIVASEGGASRAAVWTLSSFKFLDRNTGGEFGRSLFAISAVSGGSLGAVSYIEALHRDGKATGGLDWETSRASKGLGQLANADLLNVTAGTLFLNDLLARLSPWLVERLGLPDRGLALERTFERHWRWKAGFGLPREDAEGGLIRLYQDQSSPAFGAFPEVFLNGTDVATGRRVVTSSVRFDPDDFPTSDDLLLLAGADVPAATAVLNSARFPFISPPVRFVIGEGGGERSGSTAQLFDGGVFENYGARTAQEIALAVARISNRESLHLVPIIVIISDDADSARGPEETDHGEPVPLLEHSAVSCEWTPAAARKQGQEKVEEKRNPKASLVPEGLAILLGLNNVRGAHGLDALHAIRQTFCRQPTDPPTRMVHIALPHVLNNDEAAPMNWTQGSKAAHFLLESGLEASFNQEQAAALQTALVMLREPSSLTQAAKDAPLKTKSD